MKTKKEEHLLLVMARGQRQISYYGQTFVLQTVLLYPKTTQVLFIRELIIQHATYDDSICYFFYNTWNNNDPTEMIF